MPGPVTIEPDSIPTDGYTTILWAATIADGTAPTLAECIGAEDLSLYMTEFAPQLSEDAASTPRINTTDTPQHAGRSSRTITLGYTSNPQTPTADKARTTLVKKSTGYFIVCYGLAVGAALPMGTKVHVYKVHLGKQTETGAANQDLTVGQTAYVIKDYDIGIVVHS